VPTQWDVFPNAFSAAVQYASMDWPTENGWANYNGLQLLSYFAVVFLLAPAAIATGLRMSPLLMQKKVPFFPLEAARRAHWPIMVIFLVFIAIHVILVLTTGALRNLNHMYASNDGEGWGGAIVFAVSVIVMAGAWIAARPLVLRTIAGTMGRVGR
jgi:magnesium-transporting ATPase (P-type)